MATDLLGDRRLLGYLVGVVGLSAVILLLLATLFLTRVPSFTLAFVENPPGAMRDDPVAVGLVLATVLSTLLLVALIVGFGAAYGPAGPETPDPVDRSD